MLTPASLDAMSIHFQELQKPPHRDLNPRGTVSDGAEKGGALVVPNQDGRARAPSIPSFPRLTATFPAATAPAAAEHPSRPKLERTAAAFQSLKKIKK